MAFNLRIRCIKPVSHASYGLISVGTEFDAKDSGPYTYNHSGHDRDYPQGCPSYSIEPYWLVPQEAFEIIDPAAPATDDRPVVYISGPMTGIPIDQHAVIFGKAEKTLNLMGYRCINPATMDQDAGHTHADGTPFWHHDYLRRDLAAILTDPKCVGVVLIDGWRNSNGATKEAFFAQTVGLKVWTLETWDHPTQPAPEGDGWQGYSRTDPPAAGEKDGTFHHVTARLTEIENVSAAYAAQNIVLGARRFTYGHPLDNFLKIAELFNATIGHKLREPLDIRDVAMLMLQVKVAREYNAPKEDNRVDTIGYTLAYDEALKEWERRGGDPETFLSSNALLLAQHSAPGADSQSKR